MKAMLLAAGTGSRFQPHTLQKPKPALPLLNVPLGYYSFDFLKQAGVRELVVNTFHLPGEIRALYSSQSHFPVKFTEETPHILGGGGGLWNARQHFKNETDLFLLNADEVIGTPDLSLFTKLKEFHRKSGALSTLLVSEHPDVGTKFGGVWVDSKEQVLGLGKQKPAGAAKGYHFLGVQILSGEVFKLIPENVESNILYDVLLKAIQQGSEVRILKTECQWFETGNLQDYLHATGQILKLLQDDSDHIRSLLKILHHFAPGSSFSAHSGGLCWKDSSSQIENLVVQDFAVIGRHCKVQKSSLKASVLADKSSVESEKLDHELRL
ncbi:MAG: NDP-sugar synthase [Bdellovibrionales bacterium]